jgi:hypothetical protein
MKPLRLMTSKRLLPAKPSLSLPPLIPNSLARSRKRSENSMLTRRFETSGPRQGLRVHARFVQQRLVTVYFIFLLVQLLKAIMGLQKEEEEAAKKK